MARGRIEPVQVLGERMEALRAALAVCAESTEPEAVHKLRTGTRRLEAQLLLLAGLDGIPEHRSEAKAVRRWMRKLRRAAGHVRDADVERKLLKAVVAEEDPAQAELDRKLRKRRKKRARKLQRLVRKHSPTMEEALQSLAARMADASGLKLEAAFLLERIDELFRESPRGAAGAESAEDLHALRKAAKRARYQAEGVVESRTVNAAAEGYHRLQRTGGEWHDALQLAEFTAKHLGKRHPLSVQLRALEQEELGAFRAAIEEIAA